jgi:hypothetical protein
MALILFFAAACCDVGYAAQDGTNRVFDCGVNAIYLVRRLKGMDADLKEISGHLARDAKKGSSIHDLENYLHGIGIRTDARLMRLSDLCKKRDALSILLTHGKDGTGHFVAARVLANGQLQIVDSLFGAIIDENAPKSKESLPVILIDPQGRAWTWKLFALASVSMLGVLGFGLTKHRRTGSANEHT